MIDKGKYASHGSFATRMSQASRATWNKPKLGILYVMKRLYNPNRQLNLECPKNQSLMASI